MTGYAKATVAISLIAVVAEVALAVAVAVALSAAVAYIAVRDQLISEVDGQLQDQSEFGVGPGPGRGKRHLMTGRAEYTRKLSVANAGARRQSPADRRHVGRQE